MKRFFNVGQAVRAAGAVWTFLTSLPALAGTTATRIKNFRMLGWFVINIGMVGAVYVLAPQQIPVLVFKACQITMSGWIGYWFDRGIAPNTRPGNQALEPEERAAASHRRAVIVAAAMIAGALGA